MPTQVRLQRPDRDGVWKRCWTTRGGVNKSRMMLVTNNRVADLRKREESQPLSWFDDKEGEWEWVRGHE